VRDRIAAVPDDSGVPYGFERVFARLAEIGYHGIEFAGYTQNTQILGRQITPTEIRKALDDSGLMAVGNHGNVPGTITPRAGESFTEYPRETWDTYAAAPRSRSRAQRHRSEQTRQSLRFGVNCSPHTEHTFATGTTRRLRL
jgi:hypothetical protein